MSEQSDQEKTEAPTPRRLQQAAEEGRVARSNELNTAALMLGGALTLTMLAPGAGARLVALFAETLRRLGEAGNAGVGVELLRHAGWSTLAIVAVACVATASMALAIGALQARGTFTGAPMAPKWSRISPMTNGKQLVGTRPLVELTKSLVKITLVALVTWSVLRRAWPDLIDLGSRGAPGVIPTLREHGARLFLTAGVAYLAFATLDYGWQLWQHAKQMRMTKDEVRRETKQQDGDPMLKSRIRALARARLRRQMLRDVPKADVVIINPSHRAVALRYDPLAAPAPIVLAMGERKVAERIKELAREHGIPMIENKPLAIALLAGAKVGTVIPAELYIAVAEVLAFVFRQRALAGRQAAWMREEAR
ncbi:MAG: EscU/YscU/HrcU family type III secretion system export apparatus switch protein [Gemmatimonadaceae bacterium]